MADLTVNEVADRLHLEPRRVRELLERERLGGYKTGRKWAISEESLDAYLQSVQQRGGTKERILFSVAGQMQRHWDDLMPILVELDQIEPFPFHDYDLATYYSRPDEPCWPIAKGHVCRKEHGDLVLRLDNEEKLSWSYLKEHLDGDPVWQVIEEWKKAMAEDMSARHSLLEIVIRRIEADAHSGGLGWPVIPETGPTFLTKAQTQGLAVSLYYAFRLFDQVFSRCLGLPIGGYEKKDFMVGKKGVVDLGGNPVVYATGKSRLEKAIGFFLKSQEELTGVAEAQAAVKAYRRVESGTKALKGHIDRLRLAVAFPRGSLCNGCRAWAT